MVRDPGDYRWSSYRAHGFGAAVALWTPHPMYLELGNDKATRHRAWRSIVGEAIDVDLVTKIRHCVHTGLVLGSEQFREQVANMTS